MSRQQHPTLIVEWNPGVFTAYDPRTEAVRHSEQFEDAVRGFDGSAVLLTLGRKVCFLRTLSLPDTSRSELDLIVRNMAGKDLPLPIDQAAIDYCLSDQKTPEGRLASIYAVSAAHLAAAKADCHRAGLNVVLVQPSAFGVQLLARAEQIEYGIYATVGDDSASLDVIDRGVTAYSRTVKCPADFAVERLRTLASAQRPEDESQYPYYTTGPNPFGGKSIARTPMAALGQQDMHSPLLSLELWSDKIARARKVRTQRIRNASMALVAALALAAYVGYDYLSAQASSAKAISQSQKEQANIKDYASKIQSRAGTLQPSFTVLSRGFDPAQPFSDILTALSQDVPKGAWLTGLTLQRGQTMTIRGTALQAGLVNDCVERLSADSRFREVKLVFTTNVTNGKQTLVQFSISAFAVGNLPLVDKKGGSA